MTFLTPLGFLAAISIIILIIIYLIRPNYQQKYISSTFVWKLSLKYKKKRIPTSKLRDILIIICQIATLACCAAILAGPVKQLKALISQNEIIIVLDSSASMRVQSTETDESGMTVAVSRYDRALKMAESQARRVLDAGGFVSVIKASEQPEILLQHVDKENETQFNNAFADLKGDLDGEASGFDGLKGCGYGAADMDKAMALCEEVLDANPSAVTFLYTDIEYLIVPESVQIINCRAEKTSDEDQTPEWNVGILDVVSEFTDGSYQFSVKVAAYGAPRSFGVKLSLINPDNGQETAGGLDVTKTAVYCDIDEVKTITFKFRSDKDAELGENEIALSNNIISYDSAMVEIINEDDVENPYEKTFEDCFYEDNSFTLPGCKKPELKIVYVSDLRTPFFNAVLDILSNSEKSYFKDSWNIVVTTERPDIKDEDIPVTGYDFYIYEGRTPKYLPADGASLLVNVPELPTGLSGNYSGLFEKDTPVNLENKNPSHPLMKNIRAEDITVTKAHRFTFSAQDGYESLMEVNGRTVFAAKKDEFEKAAVLTFSAQYSNITLLPEFGFIVNNFINYYIPATLDKYVYEVGEEIDLNCAGYEVSVRQGMSTDISDDEEPNSAKKNFTEFPAELSISKVGGYRVKTLLSGEEYGADEKSFVQDIYIRMAGSESNINLTESELYDPYHGAGYEDFFKDLAVYVAIALVAFIFAEWFLHLREGI